MGTHIIISVDSIVVAIQQIELKYIRQPMPEADQIKLTLLKELRDEGQLVDLSDAGIKTAAIEECGKEGYSDTEAYIAGFKQCAKTIKYQL